MAYAFTDSLYGIVIGLKNPSLDNATTKTISGVNSTDGEGAAASAELFQKFATLLTACTRDNAISIQRNSRQSVEEV